MSSKFLIVGANGAIGYAVTKAIQEAGETATLLVRNRARTVELFGDLTGLSIVEGDVNVIEAAEHSGATVIFPANNYNYGQTIQPISEITPFCSTHTREVSRPFSMTIPMVSPMTR